MFGTLELCCKPPDPAGIFKFLVFSEVIYFHIQGSLTIPNGRYSKGITMEILKIAQVLAPDRAVCWT